MITLTLNDENGDDKQCLSWILRGFFIGVCKGRVEGDPQREEAYRLVNRLIALSTLESSEKIELFNEMHTIYVEVTPISKLQR